MPDPNDDDLVPDAISIARCRELLEDEARDLSDEEIDAIGRHARAMAHTLVDVFLQQRTEGRG